MALILITLIQVILTKWEQEVLFRCGNWCYTGHVVLNRNFSLSDLPIVIPLLQRQQSRLHYYCNADSVPEQSNFHEPMSMLYEAAEFAASASGNDRNRAQSSVVTFFGNDACCSIPMHLSALPFMKKALARRERGPRSIATPACAPLLEVA